MTRLPRADIEGVEAASLSFYTALSVLDDGTRMEAVWANTPYVTYVGPSSASIIVGWDAQKRYWKSFNTEFVTRSVSIAAVMCRRRLTELRRMTFRGCRALNLRLRKPARPANRHGARHPVFASLSVAQWLILRRHNTRFTTALNNMTQGLWGRRSGKLVLCNRRYAEMHELSPRLAQPGTTLHEVVQHRSELGAFSGNADEYVSRLMARIAEGKRRPYP